MLFYKSPGVVVGIVSCLVVFGVSVQVPVAAARVDDGAERKIIVFTESVTSPEERASVLARHGLAVSKDLPVLHGVSAYLSRYALSDLVHDPAIVRIDDDVRVYALASTNRQVLPWGVDRVDAERAWPVGATGKGVTVAVVDTGVSTGHPDIKANLVTGYNALSPWLRPTDDNGHGSHVAGIIGAVNNTVGVVGVAPSVKIMPVKVLDKWGSGYLSDIIAGMDWAVSHGARVINLSLGTDADIQSFHDAVRRAHDAGVTVVAAAGNSGGSVSYPAAYDEVIAVSATDQSNVLASFSSRGSQVDIAAPGVGIYSTYKSTGYATLSGTSMAAPHVAGAAALLLTTSPLGYGDHDNVWSSDEVREKLMSTATDLGTAGTDDLYGAGLLHAYAAVQ